MASSHIVLVLLFILIIVALFAAQPSDSKFTVGGFIGSIPFAFSNNPDLLKYIFVIIALIALVIVLLAIGMIK